MFGYSICRLPIHLALVRVFHGASGGVVGPATMSITADYSGGTKKGRAMGFYGMSLAAATLVGYGLSGVITSRFGYQNLSLFAVVMLSLLLPRASKRGNLSANISIGESFLKANNLFRRRGLNVSYCSIFAQYFAFGGVVTLLPLYVKSLGMEAFHVGMLRHLRHYVYYRPVSQWGSL